MNWIKKLALAATLLASSCWCLGQGIGTSNYTATASYSIVDNQTNCQTNNCFIVTDTQSNGTAKTNFISISTGQDGYVLGLDATGELWTLPIAAATGKQSLWTLATQNTSVGITGPITGIAVRNASEIYALGHSATCAASNESAVYEWAGSQWEAHNGCLKQMSVSSDDVLAGVDSYGNVWYTSNPTSTTATWTVVPASLYWTDVAVYNGTVAFAVQNGTGVIYAITLANGTYVSTGGGTDSNSLAVTPDGYLFTVGTDGYAYILNVASATTQPWVRLGSASIGTTTKLFGSVKSSIFALASETPSHYLAYAVSASVTVSGNYTCPSNGCPAKSIHTATAKISWPHTYAAGVATNAGVPSTYLQAQAQSTSSVCDPWYGDPDGPDCNVDNPITGQVECSVMGQIFSAALPRVFNWEMAYTRVASLGTKTGCVTSRYGSTKCAWNVTNWCTELSSPPDNNFTGAAITDYIIHSGWDTHEPCLSILGGPWMCSPVGPPAVPLDMAPLPQASCTRDGEE